MDNNNKLKKDNSIEEKIEENSEFDFKPYLELFKDLLKDVKLERIIESSNKVKIEKIQAEKIYNSRNLKFWQWKFVKEFLIVLIILISVGILSYYDKIESSTIGTLLGSIIGYAIGNFNSKEQKN